MLVVQWILVAAGCGVVVVSTLAALFLPPVFDQLHALTAATTVGAPLLGLGVVLHEGWTTATAMVVLTVVIVASTGPVLSAATARMSAQREHLVEEEEPE